MSNVNEHKNVDGTGPSFEEAFQRLGETVEALEKGDLTLERATVLYEEGMKLVQLCNQHLSAAELRVTELKDSYTTVEGLTSEGPEGDERPF